MNFTPIYPQILSGQEHSDLIEKADEIIYKTATLRGTTSPIVIDAIKKLLRIVNCFYSNKIEAEDTHPVDIEKAMKSEFLDDKKNQSLQRLALAYIHTQIELEEMINDGKPNFFDISTILQIHKSFYSQDGMESFLKIERDGKPPYIMRPGYLRDINVAIGNHIAPEYETIEDSLKQMLHLYKLRANLSKSSRLIDVLSFHHRLAWIHPFPDGNGRTSRLIMDALLRAILGEGYGLWNISRGLSRNLKDYKNALKYADFPKLDSHDGRGALSEKYLHEFVAFMLDICLDQIDYMHKCLRLDSLALRIEYFCAQKRAEPSTIGKVPNGVEAILKELLLKGEIKRGEVRVIAKLGDRQATNLIGWMLRDEMISSPSTKGVLRINFNSHMGSFLFPELVPGRIETRMNKRF
jgi:Fic family protein